MARHLVNAGHDVNGFNRTTAKAQAWATATGGKAAATVAQAAQDVELFILCVGNDDDVRAVVTEALPHLADGAVIVDHTTTSAKVAREMAELAEGQGRRFVDAPVSGGQAGAENGQLSVMAGGDATALATAEPALKAYSKAIKHMGSAGSGQLTKMVNQIAIAGVVQGLAEAVHFAQVAGLDTDAAYEAVSKGRPKAGRWTIAGRPRPRGVRLRFRRRLDAKGSGTCAGRGPIQRRQTGPDRPGRPVLRRGSGHGRQSLGHLQPGGEAATARLTVQNWRYMMCSPTRPCVG